MQHQAEQSRLLKLPAELRNIIYRLVVKDDIQAVIRGEIMSKPALCKAYYFVQKEAWSMYQTRLSSQFQLAEIRRRRTRARLPACCLEEMGDEDEWIYHKNCQASASLRRSYQCRQEVAERLDRALDAGWPRVY